MKLRYLLFIVSLIPHASAFAEFEDYTSLCQNDAASVGLTGSELSDYVADCISQYGVEEPTYENDYTESDMGTEEVDDYGQQDFSNTESYEYVDQEYSNE